MESTPKNLCLNYQFEGVGFMSKKVSKRDLIDNISNNIQSIDKLALDLMKAIDENSYISDETKNSVKIIIQHKFSEIDRKEFVKEMYDELERQLFKNLSSIKSGDDEKTVIIRLFEGISIKGMYVPEQEKKVNFSDTTILVKESIKIKPHITDSYSNKVNQSAFN